MGEWTYRSRFLDLGTSWRWMVRWGLLFTLSVANLEAQTLPLFWPIQPLYHGWRYQEITLSLSWLTKWLGHTNLFTTLKQYPGKELYIITSVIQEYKEMNDVLRYVYTFRIVFWFSLLGLNRTWCPKEWDDACYCDVSMSICYRYWVSMLNGGASH
jgi:hypothetical protein